MRILTVCRKFLLLRGFDGAYTQDKNAFWNAFNTSLLTVHIEFVSDQDTFSLVLVFKHKTLIYDNDRSFSQFKAKGEEGAYNRGDEGGLGL